jgi:hypothetical protein
VKRAVIKSWRVFFWSNQPQKALTRFIIRFVSGPLIRLDGGWNSLCSRLSLGVFFLKPFGQRRLVVIFRKGAKAI